MIISTRRKNSTNQIIINKNNINHNNISKNNNTNNKPILINF